MGFQFSFGARRVVLVVDNNIRLSFICFGVWSALRSFVRSFVVLCSLMVYCLCQSDNIYIHIYTSWILFSNPHVCSSTSVSVSARMCVCVWVCSSYNQLWRKPTMGTFLRTLLETIFMVPPKNILGLWAWLRLLRCSNDMTKDTTPHMASHRHFCTVHSVDILLSLPSPGHSLERRCWRC